VNYLFIFPIWECKDTKNIWIMQVFVENYYKAV